MAVAGWGQTLGAIPPPGYQPSREATLAWERADALLTERLGSEAKEFWRTQKLIRPSRLWPGVIYMVRWAKRVWVIERGRLKTELCVESAQGEPEADRIMTILDLLETDERKLWQQANITGSATGGIISDRDLPGAQWPVRGVPIPPIPGQELRWQRVAGAIFLGISIVATSIMLGFAIIGLIFS